MNGSDLFKKDSFDVKICQAAAPSKGHKLMTFGFFAMLINVDQAKSLSQAFR